MSGRDVMGCISGVDMDDTEGADEGEDAKVVADRFCDADDGAGWRSGGVAEGDSAV